MRLNKIYQIILRNDNSQQSVKSLIIKNSNSPFPSLSSIYDHYYSQSQELAREGIHRFIVQNDLYRLTCLFSQNIKMELHVQEKKLFQFYSTSIYNEQLPEELSFYQNLSTLYEFIASNPSQVLSYNLAGKFVLIKDYIGLKPKYIRVPLKPMALSAEQLRQIRLKKAEKRVSELQNELKREKRRVDELSRQIQISQLKQRELQMNNMLMKKEIFRLEEKLAVADKESVKYRKTLLFYEKQNGQGEAFISLVKKRKRFIEMVKQQYIKTNSGDKDDDQTDLQRQSPQEGPQIQQLQFGAKLALVMNCQQRNSHKYSIKQSCLQKIFGQKKGHIYYFKSQPSIRQLKQISHISVKNLTPPALSTYSKHSIILGVMPQKCIAQLDCEQMDEALYLDGVRGFYSYNKQQHKLPNHICLKENYIFTMAIDPISKRVKWAINESQICVVGIEFTQDLYAFVQMNGKNSKIQLL